MTIGVNPGGVAATASVKPDGMGTKTHDDKADFGAELDAPKHGEERHKDPASVSRQEGERWSRGSRIGEKAPHREGHANGREEKADIEATVDGANVIKDAGASLSAMMAAHDLAERSSGREAGAKAAASHGTAASTAEHRAARAAIEMPHKGEHSSRAAEAQLKMPGSGAAALSRELFVVDKPTIPAAQRSEASLGKMPGGTAPVALPLTPGNQSVDAPTDPAIESAGRDFLKTLAASSGQGRAGAEGFGRRMDQRSERPTIVAQQNIPAPVAQPSTSTASALSNLIATEPTWRAAATQAFQPLAAASGLVSAHTLKLQLHPAELGMVTANLRLTGEQLTVELRVENGEAYRRLTADSESIVKSLRAMGLDIDNVTIQQPQASSASQGRADDNNAAAGFAARDQQSSTSAQSGGNGGGSGKQASASNTSNGANGSSNAASSASIPASDGLYI